MTLNHYYKIIKYIFILGFSFLIGKSFVPLELELKENLILGENVREYFLLYKKSLNYKIEGPVRLKIITRRAIPGNSTKKYEFGYSLLLNDSKSMTVNHKKYKKNELLSEQHPGHGYTQSGITIINIPIGTHNLRLNPVQRGKPTLIRVINELYKKTEGITEDIIPLDEPKIENLLVKNNKRRYFELGVDQIVSLSGKPNDVFSIYGRTKNESIHPLYNYYQIEILENDKPKYIVVDYFLENDLTNNKNKIYQISLDTELGNFSMRFVDSNIPIYLRILKHTPYD